MENIAHTEEFMGGRQDCIKGSQKSIGEEMTNKKMEIEIGEKRIIATEDGLEFFDDEKEDTFELDWGEVWDACDNWRE